MPPVRIMASTCPRSVTYMAPACSPPYRASHQYPFIRLLAFGSFPGNSHHIIHTQMGSQPPLPFSIFLICFNVYLPLKHNSANWSAGMVPARSGKRPSPFKALLTSITRPLQWAPTDMPPQMHHNQIQLFIMFPDGSGIFTRYRLTVQGMEDGNALYLRYSRQAGGRLQLVYHFGIGNVGGTMAFPAISSAISAPKLQACSIRALSKSCFICSLMAYTPPGVGFSRPPRAMTASKSNGISASASNRNTKSHGTHTVR